MRVAGAEGSKVVSAEIINSRVGMTSDTGQRSSGLRVNDMRKWTMERATESVT
jgi:hypothetical protein